MYWIVGSALAAAPAPLKPGAPVTAATLEGARVDGLVRWGDGFAACVREGEACALYRIRSDQPPQRLAGFEQGFLASSGPALWFVAAEGGKVWSVGADGTRKELATTGVNATGIVAIPGALVVGAWNDPAPVRRITLPGGATEALALGERAASQRTEFLGRSADRAYAIVESRGLVSVGAEGSLRQIAASVGRGLRCVAAGAHHVAIGSGAFGEPGTIRGWPVEGGPSELWVTLPPDGFLQCAMSGDELVYATDTAVWRTVSGSDPVELARAVAPAHLVLDDRGLAWVEYEPTGPVDENALVRVLAR